LLSSTDKHVERNGRRAAAFLADAGEEELVEAARALDDAAWAEIYSRHAQQVYAYINFRLNDTHTAEDLTADVFVKAIGGIRNFAWRGTPLLAWLYRIAHNVTVDYRAAAARRSRLRAEAAEMVVESRDGLHALDDRADMLEAIRDLTDEQQQVVILRFYRGMSTAEVARVMDKPEGAVKAQQARALRSLRRILNEDGDREETA